MLSDPELFVTVETACRERGIIEKFETENGEEIKGRMMINVVNIPEDVFLYPSTGENLIAFEASFDFIDIRIGFVLCITKMEAASDFWFRGIQNNNAPDNVWIDFFVKTLVESIEPDGSYGVPIYAFISDHASFSAVPSTSDKS